jgi:hypothetical protein
VAFFFLFFLHGTSIGNGQQGISYNINIGMKTMALEGILMMIYALIDIDLFETK